MAFTASTADWAPVSKNQAGKEVVGKPRNGTKVQRAVRVEWLPGEHQAAAIIVADTWTGFKSKEMKWQQWNGGRNFAGPGHNATAAKHRFNLRGSNVEVWNPHNFPRKRKPANVTNRFWLGGSFFASQAFEVERRDHPDNWNAGTMRVIVDAPKALDDRMDVMAGGGGLGEFGTFDDPAGIGDDLDEIISGDDANSQNYLKNQVTVIAVWTIQRGDNRPQAEVVFDQQTAAIQIGDQQFTFDGDKIVPKP